MARTLRRSAEAKVTGAYRGVNLSGLEYGGGSYTQHYATDYSYLKSKGFNVVRLAFEWRYLQPTKSDVFDDVYRALIDDNITWAKANGMQIILDCHNYGRREVSSVERIINDADGVLTYSDFNDMWLRLSNLYKNEPVILAYALMNEPHDMPVGTTPSNFKTTATCTVMMQGAVDTIRNNGDNKIISVALDHWSSVRDFRSNYGNTPDLWITDAQNKIWYEAHCYFDSNNSGSYSASTGKTFAGSGRTMGEAGNAVERFGTWAIAKGVPSFMGEYGIPRQDPAYHTALNDFLNVMDAYSMHGTLWCFGVNQFLSIRPIRGSDYPQMEIIKMHI